MTSALRVTSERQDADLDQSPKAPVAFLCSPRPDLLISASFSFHRVYSLLAFGLLSYSQTGVHSGGQHGPPRGQQGGGHLAAFCPPFVFLLFFLSLQKCLFTRSFTCLFKRGTILSGGICQGLVLMRGGHKPTCRSVGLPAHGCQLTPFGLAQRERLHSCVSA